LTPTEETAHFIGAMKFAHVFQVALLRAVSGDS
jgi:hypothetical protein